MISAKTLAAAWEVCPATVRRMRQRGALPFEVVNTGRRVMYRYPASLADKPRPPSKPTPIKNAGIPASKTRLKTRKPRP